MTDRFFLRSLAVEHFKAVRKSGPVALTPLTVFIGNNGSGKSSLVEALETYRDIVLHGLDRAQQRWLGLEHVWNKAATRERKPAGNGANGAREPIGFHLRGTWGRGAFNAEMRIGSGFGANAFHLEKEILKLPAGRVYRRDADGTCETVSGSTAAATRCVLPTESAAPPDWVRLLQRWQFLALEPVRMGAPARQRLPGGPPLLERDGANLGQYLLSLRDASPEAFQGVLEALQHVLPYARDVRPVATEAIEHLVHLEMAEESFQVPGWLLSTGTLRVLAILACLRHPDPPPLLVVEEVENGLDPRTMHMLVEEMRAALDVGKTQILLTTHSPYLLDLLDLGHIIVVERVDGQPTFTRPDREQLGDWAESFAPGRLYTMGRLTRED